MKTKSSAIHMLVSMAKNMGESVVIMMPMQIWLYASSLLDRNMNIGTMKVTSSGFSARIDPNLISAPYSRIIYFGKVESRFLNTHLTPVSSITNAINLINAFVVIMLSIMLYSVSILFNAWID